MRRGGAQSWQNVWETPIYHRYFITSLTRRLYPTRGAGNRESSVFVRDCVIDRFQNADLPSKTYTLPLGLFEIRYLLKKKTIQSIEITYEKFQIESCILESIDDLFFVSI